MPFDCQAYFEENIEKAKKSAGGNWVGTCPECQKPGRLYAQVDPEHDKYGSFICYSCELKGRNFIPLIMSVEECDLATAKKIYGRRGDLVFARRVETPATLRARIEEIVRPTALTAAIWDDDEPKTGIELPKEFVPVYDPSRRRKWQVPDYMTERGFTREIMRKWNVGYCEKGYYAGRIIIPLECPNGNSFTARDLTGEGFPKYLNPAGVDHSLLFFGWHTVTSGADFALVEGPLDAMKLHQWGIPALAFGGKSLSNAQLKLLFSFPESTIVTVMLDPDAYTNALKIADSLRIRFDGVFVAKLPDVDEHGNKVDPGSSTEQQAWEWMDDAERHIPGRSKRTVSALEESISKFRKRFK